MMEELIEEMTEQVKSAVENYSLPDQSYILSEIARELSKASSEKLLEEYGFLNDNDNE